MTTTSQLITKPDLAAMLESKLLAHDDLARHIPGDGMLIYSEGFRAAIAAIAVAYGLDVRVPQATARIGRYDMRL